MEAARAVGATAGPALAGPSRRPFRAASTGGCWRAPPIDQSMVVKRGCPIIADTSIRGEGPARRVHGRLLRCNWLAIGAKVGRSEMKGKSREARADQGETGGQGGGLPHLGWGRAGREPRKGCSPRTKTQERRRRRLRRRGGALLSVVSPFPLCQMGGKGGPLIGTLRYPIRGA